MSQENREDLRNSISREPIYEWEGSQRESLGTITYVTKVRLQHLPCQVRLVHHTGSEALRMHVQEYLLWGTPGGSQEKCMYHAERLSVPTVNNGILQKIVMTHTH